MVPLEIAVIRISPRIFVEVMNTKNLMKGYGFGESVSRAGTRSSWPVIMTPHSCAYAHGVESVVENHDAAIERRESYVLEYRIRHADGSTRYLYERG